MRVDNCFICKKEYRVDCGSYEDEVFFCLECIKWTEEFEKDHSNIPAHEVLEMWYDENNEQFDDITFEDDGEIEL